MNDVHLSVRLKQRLFTTAKQVRLARKLTQTEKGLTVHGNKQQEKKTRDFTEGNKENEEFRKTDS